MPDVVRARARDLSALGTQFASICCMVGKHVPSATPINARHPSSRGSDDDAATGVSTVNNDQRMTPTVRTCLGDTKVHKIPLKRFETV
mmetsp:Transcript_111975/g.229260  ORF Transcript_111975/g.229260 Transcript_111975/m.229260 type:complete len:88 (-) Transcript_111975:486-749(-)